MDKDLFNLIIGAFEPKSCFYCKHTIKEFPYHTVTDKDRGRHYHAECYEKYKKELLQ